MVRISPPDDDRAQLLLVGAVALSLVVLGTVVLLNGMKFHDTIGSKGNDQALQDAIRTKGMIKDDLTELVDRIRANSSYTEYEEYFRRNISQYGGYYSNLTFNDGIVYVDVSLNETDSKRQSQLLVQDGSSPGPNRFTDNSGSANWTAVENASRLDPFNLTVTSFPPPSDDYRTLINVTNGSHFWRIGIEETGGQPTVSVVNTSGPMAPEFTFTSGDLEIDVRDGCINSVCKRSIFSYSDSVGPPYTVTFGYADPPGPPNPAQPKTVRGNYRIGSDSQGTVTGGGSPRVEGAVIVPSVDITYQRPELSFNKTVVLNETG